MARVRMNMKDRMATATCRKCFTKHEIVVPGRDINNEGDYRQKWLCPDCNDGRHRRVHGRTLDEIRAMGKVNAESVKQFTKEDIAKVAHLYGTEIPKKKERIFR